MNRCDNIDMINEDEINAKLMLTLMKEMTPKIYVDVRKRIVEHGLTEAILINALIAELHYVSTLNGAATLIVVDDDGKATALVAEGALVDAVLSDDGLDQSGGRN
jgi:hypothetical protein